MRTACVQFSDFSLVASNRSFLVFNLDQHRQFSKLIHIVDQVLHEYRYPSYYEVQPLPKLDLFSSVWFRLESLFSRQLRLLDGERSRRETTNELEGRMPGTQTITTTPPTHQPHL